MCAAGTSRRITCRWWWSSLSRRGERRRAARMSAAICGAPCPQRRARGESAPACAPKPLCSARPHAWPFGGRRPGFRFAHPGDKGAELIPTALDPALEIDQRERALVVGGLLERHIIEIADPRLFGGGAVARQREPHQAACHL